MFKVEISGRDLTPCARLLEALTKANLLSPSIVWDETLDKVIIEIEGDERRKYFEQKRFICKDC